MHPAISLYLFQIVGGFGFGLTATVYALFLRELGATYQQLLVVNMVYWATVVLMELPTGMLADGKSRAWSVRIGSAFTALGALQYVLADSIGAAFVGEFFLGLGAAFVSGALQAWVADSLKRGGEFHRLRHTFATASIGRSVAILLGGLIGAYIAAATDLRSIIVLHFAFCCLQVLVALLCMNGDGEPEHRVTEAEAFRLSWRLLLDSRALRWSTLAAVAFGVVVLWNMYWNVFFLPRVGQTGLGWVWVALYGAVTLSGFLVRRMKVEAGKEEVGMVISLVATAAGFVLASRFESLPLLVGALMLHEAGRGGFEPLLDSFTHHHVDSSHRATFGSFQSLISRVGFVAALAVGTLATMRAPESDVVIRVLWLFGGLLLLVVSAVLYARRPRHA